MNKVLSLDNVLVPVPKGYTISTIETEKSVSTGLVIKEGDNGSLTSGINEFVWVPVNDISEIYDSVNNAGKLYEFNETTSDEMEYAPTLYREPDVVTSASIDEESTGGDDLDSISDNLQQAGLSSAATVNDFKSQLRNEFDEMIESVEKYGGFYIGRYETGNLSEQEAVVQKGNTDISNKIWYTQYKLSKTIGANNNVVTNMIWGCQWDATLRWMQTSDVEKVKNFPTDKSKTYGNYTSSKLPTGSSDTYAINNIYDMVGNVNDWTIEAAHNNRRTIRGGGYGSSLIVWTASIRRVSNPESKGNDIGSRSTLYISIKSK